MQLAHIRRHDYLVNLLQAFVEDLLFYHPAVWWVSSVIRAERENCCDDVVAAHGNARAFAEALATLEQYRWAAHDAALAANGGHLMHRIQRLLGRDSVRVIASPALPGVLPVALVIVDDRGVDRASPIARLDLATSLDICRATQRIRQPRRH